MPTLPSCKVRLSTKLLSAAQLIMAAVSGSLPSYGSYSGLLRNSRQRGEVPGDVHTARVAAAQPAPVPAAGALPRRREAVRVEGGEDGDVRGVHQLRDQGVLGQRWSLVRGPGSPTLL